MSAEQSTKINSLASVKNAGMRAFTDYLKGRQSAIASVGTAIMKPERITRIVLACVARTPKLQECTLESIFRSTLLAVELGLEPGSALGEAYLVPYKTSCQMIPGYRGLVSLAFRSGHVKSVRAKEVYEGDVFDYDLGLNLKLEHKPGDNVGDASKITHAYCVIDLKDGAVLVDVMTRKEIDRIRNRSAAGSSGPWVTDYAEMAKKTVFRRLSKYAPMSVEMSKAIALDNAVDTQDMSFIESDVFDGDFTVNGEPTEEPQEKTGVNSVKSKLGMNIDKNTGEVLEMNNN